MSSITKEDKDIAFNSIILNMVLLALEIDIAAIENSKLKLKNSHLKFLNTIHQQVSNDLVQNRQQMRKKGIKVMEKEIVSEDFWRYPFICRGYESEFRCFIYALRNYVEKKMDDYISL